MIVLAKLGCGDADRGAVIYLRAVATPAAFSRAKSLLTCP
jgi:hypothetical protein